MTRYRKSVPVVVVMVCCNRLQAFRLMNMRRRHSSTNSALQTITGSRLRDLLKIGQLVLDSGRWKEHQVVPASWIKESTAFRLRRSDSNPDEGYGYQWWRASFKVNGTNHPYIFASGYAGQFLWIIPNLDLVIVAMNHITSVQKGRTIISPKEIEELILPVLINATRK